MESFVFTTSSDRVLVPRASTHVVSPKNHKYDDDDDDDNDHNNNNTINRVHTIFFIALLMSSCTCISHALSFSLQLLLPK